MFISIKKVLLLFFLVPAIDCYSQEPVISLNFSDTELIVIFDEIEEQTGYFFLFNEKLINTRQKLSIDITNQGLITSLETLFSSSGIKFSVIDKKIILSPDIILFPELPVTGIVKDEYENPLPGVNIQIGGTTKGTYTDFQGRYTLNLDRENDTLVFTFIGYETLRIPVKGASSLDISMKPAISNLQEVIVVGYGAIKKSDLTGAISAVNEKNYAGQPVIRIDDILQGRSAGVNVMKVSGGPGGTTSIRIRGPNSINGNNDPLYVIDGFVGGNIENVNPSDIESLQILKDASSTAIYGSRGANGVILITTKSGKPGISHFSVGASFSMANPIKLWPVLTAGEFAQVANERADALGYARPFTENQVEEYFRNGGTDWQDLLYRTGGGKEIHFDYSGGSESTTFFISGNYYNQNGIIINSYFERFTLRFNLDAQLSETLRGSLKVNFATRGSNNTKGRFTTNGLVAGAAAWSPTTPAYDSDGNLTAFDPICSIKTNPIELATNDMINEINTFSAKGNFIYKIFKDLSFDLGLGMDYDNNQGKTYDQQLMTKNASAERSYQKSLFLQSTNYLTYKKIFNEKHDITITGVAEYQLHQSEFFAAGATNLYFPYLRYDNITLAGSYIHSNGNTKSTIGSYICRLNYNLRNRYLMTLSLRNDRSSKFRGKSQSSVFPSVGLGWRISEEAFMERLPLLSNLKIRASWGQTGSQAVDVYGTVTRYNNDIPTAAASWESGDLTPGIIIGNPGNDNLKWETTTQTNLGFDIGFVEDRLTLETDYFLKNTRDILLNEPLPGYMGGGSIYRNLGIVQNKGVELNMNAFLIDRRKFSWNLNFNILFIDNKVIDIGTSYILMRGGAGAGQVTNSEMILKRGYPISS